MTAIAKRKESSSASFSVKTGETVTAWAMGPVEAVYYPGEEALAEDRVQYRFINGFVDVGDLPCRVALWREIKDRRIERFEEFPVTDLYLPGFNRRVEFSGFWHRPMRLSRWLISNITAPRTGSYRFRLATCGGVNIWVDGEHIVSFEPFQRNRESETEIDLPIRAEGSEIVVLTEEMAERDCLWYFELQLLSRETMTVDLPVNASDTTVSLLKELAVEVCPKPFHVVADGLTLVFTKQATVDVHVRARILPSVHMRDKPPILDVEGILKAGQSALSLKGAETLPDGYHPLHLTFSVGDAHVSRDIAFATFREPARDLTLNSLSERKTMALAYAADYGEQRAGKAIAWMMSGKPLDDTFDDIIDNTLAAINERRDCSDFIMVPLLWLYGLHRDQLPDETRKEIKNAVLNYRYWVDEPGNDVMWFWSENHVLCFHVSQYLAGLLFPDERFMCSGRSGEEQQAFACQRLHAWLDSVERHGLAEWNSAAYYPIDFIGLFALYQFADIDIKARAKVLLDRLFLMIGLHTLAGVPAGTMGRAYDKELRAGPLTELAPFATVAFGKGWFNDGVAALTMFAAGDYAPPQAALDVVEPAQGKALTAHYVQGHDEAARLSLYKTANVQLSSMVDGKPGGRGHQQHVVDIRFAAHPFARAWINHPGEDDPWGSQRPSYWAGNGSMPRAAQYENMSLMLYDLGENPRIGFTHAYVQEAAFDTVDMVDNWIVLRSGKGFAALTATNKIAGVKEGPGAGVEFRATGNRCGWFTIIGEGHDDTAFLTFRESLSSITLKLDEDTSQLHVSRPGQAMLSLDWASGLSVDNRSYSFPNRTIHPLVEY